MKIDSSLAAVVTGGASGLGLATVKALRAAGVKVAIFDRNPEAGAKAAADVGALFCECDVLSDESVDAAFAKARAANGQERVLVCCAGGGNAIRTVRSEEHTSELQSLMRISYAVFCLKKKKRHKKQIHKKKSGQQE